MTEDVGFPPAEAEPKPLPEAPVLDEAAAEPEAAEAVPEPAAVDEAATAPPPQGEPGGPPQPAEEPPDHVAPPFIPDQGVAGWLKDFLLEVHNRLRALERG